MARKIKKGKTRYQKALVCFFLILLFLSEAAICYVGFALKDYENNVPSNYMEKLVNNITYAVKHNNADKYFSTSEITNKYEDDINYNAGYKELFTNCKISYKEVSNNTYDLYADDILIATITLDDSQKASKLGLLKYSKLQLAGIKTYTDEGLYTVDAYISSEYILYINNNKVSASDIVNVESVSGYDEIAEQISVPGTNHYIIKGFSQKPEVSVTDQIGNEISISIQDNKYYAISSFKTDKYEDAMAKLENKIDPIKIAEKWSLYMSKDLSGNRYGFDDISQYLIEGTSLYKSAYAWATGVDINFTSPHTLDNPIFKNEAMTNFIVYNKNSFSVDVHLEKNINVINGVTKNDIFAETMYFTYINNNYKLVSMKTITD